MRYFRRRKSLFETCVLWKRTAKKCQHSDVAKHLG